MILRDQLARDRTVLANERTLLAYIRTAIALFAGGGTVVALFPRSLLLQILGAVLLLLGVVVLGVGTWRFAVVASRLRRIASSPSAGEEDQSQSPAERTGPVRCTGHPHGTIE